MKLKQITSLLFLIVLSTNVISQKSLHSDNLFNHLVDVNEQWNHYSSAVPFVSVAFKSDEDRIQTHLVFVENFLRKNYSNKLNKTQLFKRNNLLNQLHDYALAKVFPQNRYHKQRQPYFVDERGVHCAVGYLMAVSGYTEMVENIRLEYNYDYIADIKTEGVAAWAEEHGFTIDELKWIQPGYPPNAVVSPMGTGTNGVVNEMKFDPYNGRMIISGKFSSLDDLPCLNIGYFKNGELSCLGDGIAGEVNSIIPVSSGVYVFGSLEDGTTKYPCAFYDGLTWNFIGIPTRDSATCTAVTFGTSAYIAMAAISHGSIPGAQEIWFLTNGLIWEKHAQVNGVILVAESTSLGRTFVGHFDTLSVFDSFGMIQTNYAVTNIAVKTSWGADWYGLNGNVSDTIKAVQDVSGSIYFGGSCSSNPGISNVCLTRYYNDVFQPLYIKESYMGTEDFSVNTIAYKWGSSNSMVIGGNFQIEPWGIGTFGNNLAFFNLVSNSLSPQAIFNAPVNSVAYMGNTIYIGGDFTQNLSSTEVNHIGRIINYTEIDEANSSKEISIYPNPFTEFVNVKGIPDGITYKIINSAGQQVSTGIVSSQKINGLENLSAGIYFLHLETDEGIVVRKILK